MGRIAIKRMTAQVYYQNHQYGGINDNIGQGDSDNSGKAEAK